jgi:peptidoglycan/LPS O-acetylase OafA/YrhL
VEAAGRRQHQFPLIDALRGVAALSVLYYHVTFSFGYPHGIWADLSQRVAGPPVTAVVVFFVISGFVLYRPFARARLAGAPPPALVPYAVRRAARIVPGYWVALAIVSVMLSEHAVHTPLGALRYFGFAQIYGDWNTTTQGGISPAWTLCVEVTFYAALPLLAFGVRRIAARRSFLASELAFCATLVLISIVWQAAILSGVSVNDPLFISLLGVLPGTIDLFAYGMALAAVSVWLEAGSSSSSSWTRPRWVAVVERRPWLPWLLAVVAFGSIGRLASLGHSDFTAWWLLTHQLKALGSLLLLSPLVFGGARRDLPRRLLGSRPMLYLGTISYGVYLWHFPLLHKLAPHLVHHGEVFTTVALAAVTIAVASLSYYLVERPAQTLARRFLRRRAARAAPGTVAVGSAAEPDAGTAVAAGTTGA